MQQWYQCPRCNSPVSYGAQFCNNCGQPLNWQQSQPPPQQPPQYQQPQQTPQYQQQYQQPKPPKKKSSKLGIILLGSILLALAAVGSCVVCVMQPGSSDVTSPETSPSIPPATPQPEPAIRITCEKLTQECMDNEVAWDQKYKGKLVEVSGVLGTIDYEYVTLESGLFLTDMHCSLRGGQESQLAQLVKGERITVRGVCKTCGAFGVTLIDCVLVRAYEGPGETEAGKEPVLVSKDASELVLAIGDFESGWVQDSREPSTKEGAHSAYSVYFYEGGTVYPAVVQNIVAVYPSIELAEQVYIDEVPTNISVETPDIGDECFLDVSIPVEDYLVFRKSNVVVWLWLQQDMFGDVKSYGRIVEQKIPP